MCHVSLLDRTALNFFGDTAGPIPVLNMAQFYQPQISTDGRSAPSIDPRHWTLDRVFANILSPKWRFYALHGVLMTASLEENAFVGLLGQLLRSSGYGLKGEKITHPS